MIEPSSWWRSALNWEEESKHLDKKIEVYYISVNFAGVAQLVEHNLAKVRVAGSSPVFRSNGYYAAGVVFFLAARVTEFGRLLSRYSS